MQKFVVLLLVVMSVFIQGCKNSKKPDNLSGPALDLSEYIVEPIEGSDVQMVTRLTPQGFLEEQGMVKNGKKTGTWAVFFPPQMKIKEIWNYEAGQLNGLHIVLNNSGRVDMYESFRNNQLHGKKATFKQGTPVEEISYKNGKMDGVFRGFFPTGKLQRFGYYKDGKMDGKYLVYDAEGNVATEANYENGVQIK